MDGQQLRPSRPVSIFFLGGGGHDATHGVCLSTRAFSLCGQATSINSCPKSILFWTDACANTFPPLIYTRQRLKDKDCLLFSDLDTSTVLRVGKRNRCLCPRGGTRLCQARRKCRASYSYKAEGREGGGGMGRGLFRFLLYIPCVSLLCNLIPVKLSFSCLWNTPEDPT